MRAFLALVVCLICLPAYACHKSAPTAPETEALSSITLFPLIEGTNWRYDYYHSISQSSQTPKGRTFTVDRTYGHLILKVEGNLTEQDRQRYQREFGTSGIIHDYMLEMKFVTDSLKHEVSRPPEPGAVSSLSPGTVEQRSLALRLERDTLWYVSAKGLEFMLPRQVEPTGSINLRLFKPPDVINFPAQLVRGAETGWGDLLYQNVETRQSIFARVVQGLGVRGIIAEYVEGSPGYSQSWTQDELIFVLVDTNIPGAVVPDPGKNW